jgi:hypothetical protein
MDPYIQLVLDNVIKQISRVVLELLTRENIVEERRPQNLQVLGS